MGWVGRAHVEEPPCEGLEEKLPDLPGCGSGSTEGRPWGCSPQAPSLPASQPHARPCPPGQSATHEVGQAQQASGAIWVGGLVRRLQPPVPESSPGWNTGSSEPGSTVQRRDRSA